MGSARALWIGHFLPWRPESFRREELEEVKTLQFRTRNDVGQAKYPPKRYVYSGKTVFASEKTSTRNDEPCEIIFVRFDRTSKTAKKPTRQISKTPSVGFTEAKNRVQPKVAPELCLSMFQRDRKSFGITSGQAEKLSIQKII